MQAVIAQKGTLARTGGKTSEFENLAFIKKAEGADDLIGRGITQGDAGFADVSGGSFVQSDANFYQEFVIKNEQKPQRKRERKPRS